MRSATSSTSSSSSASGKARLAQPRRTASTPEIESPVTIISMAARMPEEPGVEVHVGHAEAHRRVAHLGVLGDVDEVAAGGQLAAAGQAVAVHLGDHRLGQVPDAHPRLGDVAGPLALAGRGEVRQVEALVAAAQVVAGREAGAGAADDRDPDVVVVVGLLQRGDQLARAACGSSALRFSGRLRVTRRTRGAGSSMRTSSGSPVDRTPSTRRQVAPGRSDLQPPAGRSCVVVLT